MGAVGCVRDREPARERRECRHANSAGHSDKKILKAGAQGHRRRLCGFGEVSYFNRCFPRRFGEPPSRFRGGDPSGN